MLYSIDKVEWDFSKSLSPLKQDINRNADVSTDKFHFSKKICFVFFFLFALMMTAEQISCLSGDNDLLISFPVIKTE